MRDFFYRCVQLIKFTDKSARIINGTITDNHFPIVNLKLSDNQKFNVIKSIFTDL